MLDMTCTPKAALPPHTRTSTTTTRASPSLSQEHTTSSPFLAVAAFTLVARLVRTVLSLTRTTSLLVLLRTLGLVETTLLSVLRFRGEFE